MPQAATDPCRLDRLPPSPTRADLEDILARRGASIVACDIARQLAVDTAAAEHRDIDAWLETLP